jgi:hypothetical protein
MNGNGLPAGDQSNEGGELVRVASPLDPLPLGVGADLPEDIRFALGSRFRRALLRCVNARPNSGHDASEAIPGALSIGSYHVRVLQGCELITEHSRRNYRGSYRCLYRAKRAVDAQIVAALAATETADRAAS